MFFLLVISGDGQSLIAQIYDKQHRRMLYTATRILGIDDAEDAVHDVFAKIIEKFENNIENLGDKPAHFFVIVVKNHSLDLLRKKHLNTVPFEDESLEYDLTHPSSASPEVNLLNNEAVERLAVLIRKLTPAMRQVFEYKYIEGYSNIEIADMLDISQSAVSTRIDKAKKRLKELL